MRGGKREGAGRPLSSPTGEKLKNKSVRMTEQEYLKVKEYLKQLREKTKEA
jgi:hypothetical protein